MLATAHTRPTVAQARPDVVVHDILTLAPALAGELEGLPVATLIPHVYPGGRTGLSPVCVRSPDATHRGRPDPVAGVRPAGGQGPGPGPRGSSTTPAGSSACPPVTRFHGGLSTELVLVGTYPELEYPRAWPDHVHIVGPLIWEPPSDPVQPPPGDAPLVLVAPSTAQDPEHRLLRAALGGPRARAGASAGHLEPPADGRSRARPGQHAAGRVDLLRADDAASPRWSSATPATGRWCEPWPPARPCSPCPTSVTWPRTPPGPTGPGSESVCPGRCSAPARSRSRCDGRSSAPSWRTRCGA